MKSDMGKSRKVRRGGSGRSLETEIEASVSAEGVRCPQCGTDITYPVAIERATAPLLKGVPDRRIGERAAELRATISRRLRLIVYEGRFDAAMAREEADAFDCPTCGCPLFLSRAFNGHYASAASSGSSPALTGRVVSDQARIADPQAALVVRGSGGPPPRSEVAATKGGGPLSAHTPKDEAPQTPPATRPTDSSGGEPKVGCFVVAALIAGAIALYGAFSSMNQTSSTNTDASASEASAAAAASSTAQESLSSPDSGAPSATDADAQGDAAFEAKNYELATMAYLSAALQKDAHAETRLGWIYENGLGTDQDYDMALRWYEVATEQRDPEGEYLLGRLYASGSGVDPDPEKAHELISNAADAGYAPAQRWIAVNPQ